MRFLGPLKTAFAMYSSIPVNNSEWTKYNMTWAICCFPLVGLVIGVMLCAWMLLSMALSLPSLLFAGGAMVLPILLSGGIHMDGFCDTCDALASNAPKDRKLDILKDTHAGAFSGIGCSVYSVLMLAAWASVELNVRSIIVLSLTPALSRSLSAFAAVTMPNARGSGLLSSFTEHTDTVKARLILLCTIIIIVLVIIIISPLVGIAISAAAALIYLYYTKMSAKYFGGITGDLAGFFLQLCELCAVFLAAVIQHINI